MKLTFFPFTFFDLNTHVIWLGCFPRLGVYCPADETTCPDMVELAQQGEFDLRIVHPENGPKVAALTRAYKEWKTAHGGVDSAFFRETAATTPFFDETGISRLRQDIRDSMAGNAADSDDPVLTAQLFLALTHEYDREQAVLDRQLLSMDEREKIMLGALHGNDTKSPEPAPFISRSKRTDPGAHLTAERLRAWSILAACDDRQADVLVTASRAVFEYVREMLPDADTVVESAAIDVADAAQTEDLACFIEQLVTGDPAIPPEAEETQMTVSYSIIRSPSMSTADVIAFFAGSGENAPSSSPAAVIVYIG